MSRLPPLVPGFVAAGLVVGIIGASLGALFVVGSGADGSILGDPYVRRIVVFTLWQAGLSAVLAVGLAIPVARALARRRFPGRTALLHLFGLPLVLPVIVAVFGIVLVFGGHGWINQALDRLSLGPLGSLYGLQGILLAHVFFNLPLAVRALLLALATVPGESWRLAAQLGMAPAQVFRFVEWPVLRQALPGIATLVFFLCFTSFAAVLTLGGGPAATVLEVAIYQALRLDFDLGRAGSLAIAQLAICGLVAAGLLGLGRSVAVTPELGRATARPDVRRGVGALGDGLAIAIAAALVALPLAALVARGLTGPLSTVLRDPAIWSAAGRSLAVGVSAAALALAVACGLAVATRELRLTYRVRHLATAPDMVAALPLATSVLALGAGLFALLHRVVAVFDVALILVAGINALFVLPYAMRLIAPRMLHVAEAYGPLCASLGISGWNRLRLVEWPSLRAPVGLALALGAALAAGDLGAVALFGTQDTATLPLLLYQRMASYRMEEAAVIALLLMAIAGALFIVLERGIGGREHP